MRLFYYFLNKMIFVGFIENPSFDSQSKETLTTQITKFGSKCELSEKFYEKLFKLFYFLNFFCYFTIIKLSFPIIYYFKQYFSITYD